VATSAASSYRLAPAVVVRFLGLALVALAVLLLGGTVVVAVTGLPIDLLVGSGLLGAAACGVLAWWLRTRAWVLRCTDRGYRVRMVRGAGVTAARWEEVEQVVATYRHDVACLELRLRDGRTTTVPVGLLETDRDELARHLQARLQRGRGLRPL
jgi:hypothetical protein